MGHYCGSEGSAAINSILSSASDANGGSESDSLRNATGIALEAETLWIKFNSDESGTSRGFVAYYYLGKMISVPILHIALTIIES